MFYIEKDNKIVLFNENKQELIKAVCLMPWYQGLEIKETDRPIVDFEFADTKEFEEKKQKEERERLDTLSLTAADIERAIYKVKGMDFDDLLAFVSANTQISSNPSAKEDTASEASLQNAPAPLDLKALKIELKANNFFRGNPYINAVGTLLGFSSTQLDEFFETGDYTALLPVEDETGK